MPQPHEATLRQLGDEAARYAQFYFDPKERIRMLSACGRQEGGMWAVLIENQFVPLDGMPEIAPVLRRLGRGTRLDDSEMLLLEEYRSTLSNGVRRLHVELVAGQPAEAVKAIAQSLSSWPAVALVESQDEMRSMLLTQFERMRQKRIAWRADSSTYSIPTRNGAYFFIQWFWHG